MERLGFGKWLHNCIQNVNVVGDYAISALGLRIVGVIAGLPIILPNLLLSPLMFYKVRLW